MYIFSHSHVNRLVSSFQKEYNQITLLKESHFNNGAKITMPSFIQNIDEAIHFAIQSGWHADAIDQIMRFFSVICNHGEIWIAVALLMICFPKTRKFGFALGFTMLIEFILCDGVMKNIFQRTRPYNSEFAAIHGFTPYLPKLNSWSFPSGHSMVSAVAAASIWQGETHYLTGDTAKNKFFKRHLMGIIAIVIAVIIIFSRVYLFMHWPSDVLTASLLGIILSIVLLHFVYWPLEKKIISRKKAGSADK